MKIKNDGSRVSESDPHNRRLEGTSKELVCVFLPAACVHGSICPLMLCAGFCLRADCLLGLGPEASAYFNEHLFRQKKNNKYKYLTKSLLSYFLLTKKKPKSLLSYFNFGKIVLPEI